MLVPTFRHESQARLDSPLGALAYVGLPATDLTAWSEYATGLLGLQLGEQAGGQLGFRMDRMRQRLFVGAVEAPVAGWEVLDDEGLHQLVQRLDAAGVPHAEMGRVDCERRCVSRGIRFRDPDRNPVEVVLGLETAGEPFTSGRSIRGFRTGSLGMGHFVLTSPQARTLLDFYVTVLGFGLSDYCGEPFEAYFCHLNARHHSLAIIQANSVGVHHLMVEMNGLDDVGQAYDLALCEQDRVAVSLGRHSNDHMTSFYSRTPSGPLIECGWGGLSLKPNEWDAYELAIGPSLWGHERTWLPDDLRSRALKMRLDAAAEGAHAAVHVHGDNFDVAPRDPAED